MRAKKNPKEQRAARARRHQARLIATLLIEFMLILPVYSAYAISINNLALKDFTASSTSVEWDTDKAGNTTALWGENNTITSNKTVNDAVTHHRMTIETQSNKTYIYVAQSCEGNACAATTPTAFRAGADTSTVTMNVSVPDVVNTNRVNLRATTKPYSTVKLYLEGALTRIANPTDAATGEIVFSNLILPKTDNTIRLESTDQQGNRAELTIKVTVDPTPPMLEIRNFPDVLQQPSFVLNGRTNKKCDAQIFVTPANTASAPPRVRGLKLKGVTPNQATLSWDPVERNDTGEYGIYRDDKLIGITKSTEFADPTPASGRSYNYRAQATDINCNKGDLSDSIDVAVPRGGNTIVAPPQILAYACDQPTFRLTADGDFTQPIQLLSGTTNIKVICTDRAGNSAAYTNSTLFDNQPPQFIETNLDALSPSYTSDIIVRGKVSEKSTVLVYINNEASPSAYGTTNDDGTFAIKTKLRRDTRVGQTGAGTNPNTRTGSAYGDLTGEGYQNTVKLQAVDIAKNVGEAGPASVVLAQCGFGTGFSVNIGKPKPDVLNPRLILKNFGTVGFNVELSYLDSNETLDSLDEPSVLVRPVSLEEQPKWDLDLVSSRRCSPDNKKCYVQLTVRPPAGIENMNTTWEKEQYISDHRKDECLIPGVGCYKIPLELEIRYQKKQPTGDLNQNLATHGQLGPRIEPLTQRVCIPVEIAIDKRIDPKLLPNSLLKSSVELFDSAISAIDSILQPLQTVFNVVFYACYLGFTIGFFLDFTQTKSCEGSVITGLLTQGSFNPEVAQNGMCGIYYPEDKPELELSRQNCMQCQKSINDRKSTMQNMHQLCDRIFCPSAPSLQKYITDMQRKGVKPRAAASTTIGQSKEFYIGSDCAAATFKPNLYQGKSGTNEIGIDEIFQIYKLHKNDKPDGDKGITEEALKPTQLKFEYSGRTGAAGQTSTTGDGKDMTPGSAPESEVKGESKINCANNHPSTMECCGYEYQQTWGPVCSLMMPDYEITESRCLSAQQTQSGAVSGCQGFRQTLNSIGGFCSKSMDVSQNLVPTTISYGKLTSEENDPLNEIQKSKDKSREEKAKKSGFENLQESRLIYVDENERKQAQEAENDAVSRLWNGRTLEQDVTHGRLPDYIKDRRVYLKILPQEGGAFKVERGYVVEKATMLDMPTLDPTKKGETLTETLEFVPDAELTQFFQAPKDGGPLVYNTIEMAWITSLCSREAVVTAGAPASAEGTIPRPGAGKSYMIGCSKPAAKTAWDEVRKKVGVGDRDYIVNPAEDLTSSLKCGCLPGIMTHLKKWKGIMTAVRNCFNAVLVTGDGTPGACEAVLSRYICDFIYTLIKCFVQRYTAGNQRPEAEGAQGSLTGIGGIGSMLVKGGTSVTQDLQSRYGGSPTYKAAFSEDKMVNSVCLFAFTGTFNLKPEALAESEIANIPVDSQPFMFPCEKRFIQFDVASQPQGLATWNYHIGADLFAGADVTYTVKLTCSNGFDCDPTEGFQNGQCDCSKIGEKTQAVLSGNLKQFENIGERGEIFENVQQKWRYDKATLEWSYRDKDGKAKTGQQTCKIETIGGEAPVFCAFDILQDSFRCSTDLFSDYYAKFSGTIAPNYPDPLAQVFKLGDDTSFSVPVVQRVPEGAVCTAGRTCSATKYLIYSIKNAQGTVISTNDQAIYDPSKTGTGAVTTDVNAFADVSPDQTLNTQGEKIYTIRLGTLGADHFNYNSMTTTGGYARAVATPDTVEPYIQVAPEAKATRPGYDLIFEISKPRETGTPWTVYHASGGVKTGSQLEYGTSQQNIIRSQGYIITLKSPDRIDKEFTVFIPTLQVPSTLTQKRCDLSKPSSTTETWTATFEIRDANQQSLGSNLPGTQTSIVNGRAQIQTISFNTICNTGIPLGKQRGECTEMKKNTFACYCYPTREKVADELAAGHQRNCALSSANPQYCIDGACVAESEVKVCPTDTALTSADSQCTCGYKGGDQYQPIRCNTGDVCQAVALGNNVCAMGAAQTGAGGTTATGAAGASIRIQPGGITKDKILKVLNSRRPGRTDNDALAESFIRQGANYGIDPSFLVALAAAETSIGTGANVNVNNCNNLFNIEAKSGRAVCAASNRWAAYTSQDASIEDAAKLFSNNYLPIGQDTLETIGGPFGDCSQASVKAKYPCCSKGSGGTDHCYCCDGAESNYLGWKSNIETVRREAQQS